MRISMLQWYLQIIDTNAGAQHETSQHKNVCSQIKKSTLNFNFVASTGRDILDC